MVPGIVKYMTLLIVKFGAMVVYGLKRLVPNDLLTMRTIKLNICSIHKHFFYQNLC